MRTRIRPTAASYLAFPDGRRSYFPRRTPRTVRFKVDDRNPGDQYARLYSAVVVDTINALALPRYGLGNYIASDPEHAPDSGRSSASCRIFRAPANV